MKPGYATYFKVIGIILAIICGAAAVFSLFTSGDLVSLLTFGIPGIIGYFTYQAIGDAIFQLIDTHEHIMTLEDELKRLPELIARQVAAELNKPESEQQQSTQAMADAFRPMGEAIVEPLSEEKIAVVDRSLPTTICPFCQKEQRSNRNICFSCGAKFMEHD